MSNFYNNTKVPIRGTKSTEQPGLSLSEIEELKDAFKLFQIGESLAINPSELQTSMQNLGFDQKNPAIFDMIKMMGKQYNEKIGFDEFLEVMVSELCKTETRDQINQVFQLFDEKNQESIDPASLAKVASELGEALSENDLKELLSKAASNHQTISKEDFYNIMTKQTY